MNHEVKREDIFIPSWNKNKKLPAGEQIKVHHRFLTPSERESFVYVKPLDISGPVEKQKVEFVQDTQGIARTLILKIEGFTISAKGILEVIDTAEKLFETQGVPAALVAEIEGYLRFVTPEVDKVPLG